MIVSILLSSRKLNSIIGIFERLPRIAEVAQPDPLKRGGKGEHPAEDDNI
jgi:hypothetical protein